MADAEPPKILLYAGDCLVSRNPADMFCTLLGSCVSTCIFDPVAGVGGMNHFLLPFNREDEPSARYGDDALLILLQKLYLNGAVRHRLLAKVYGGGRMMTCGLDIGQMNIAFASKFLRDSQIEIVDSAVGGTAARWIDFHPSTGRSSVRQPRNQDTRASRRAGLATASA